MLDVFLFSYIQTASEKSKLAGDKTWLLRELVISSMEDSLRDQRDNTFSLAYLYVMAGEKDLNLNPEFQAIAEISSDEILLEEQTISMSELMKDIPNVARKTDMDWKKYD